MVISLFTPIYLALPLRIQTRSMFLGPPSKVLVIYRCAVPTHPIEVFLDFR